MQPESIGAVLQKLESRKEYWAAPLPEGVRFNGEPVELRIRTESVATGSMPPPNKEMLTLARLVLAGVESLLTQAERELVIHQEESEPVDTDAPRICIEKDTLMDDGPTRWTINIGNPEVPDDVTHIEFEGTEFLEVWTGV